MESRVCRYCLDEFSVYSLLEVEVPGYFVSLCDQFAPGERDCVTSLYFRGAFDSNVSKHAKFLFI